MEAISELVIEKLRNGSEEAFRKIYDLYFTKLFNFAVSYVIVRDEAADIVQTVFLSLWDKRESLAKNTNLNNYLVTLTRNQSLNHLRHNRAGMNYQSYQQGIHDELILNYYALERLNDSRFTYEELETRLHEALDSMPVESRESFLLSRVEGKRYFEIAEKMNISVKTVEKKMSQALGILREALKDYLTFLF
jgi:RNA polymerase sigma-70 factor (ECF subfamily)